MESTHREMVPAHVGVRTHSVCGVGPEIPQLRALADVSSPPRCKSAPVPEKVLCGSEAPQPDAPPAKDAKHGRGEDTNGEEGKDEGGRCGCGDEVFIWGRVGGGRGRGRTGGADGRGHGGAGTWPELI